MAGNLQNHAWVRAYSCHTFFTTKSALNIIIIEYFSCAHSQRICAYITLKGAANRDDVGKKFELSEFRWKSRFPTNSVTSILSVLISTDSKLSYDLPDLMSNQLSWCNDLTLYSET